MSQNDEVIDEIDQGSTGQAGKDQVVGFKGRDRIAIEEARTAEQSRDLLKTFCDDTRVTDSQHMEDFWQVSFQE